MSVLYRFFVWPVIISYLYFKYHMSFMQLVYRCIGIMKAIVVFRMLLYVNSFGGLGVVLNRGCIANVPANQDFARHQYMK